MYNVKFSFTAVCVEECTLNFAVKTREDLLLRTSFTNSLGSLATSTTILPNCTKGLEYRIK